MTPSCLKPGDKVTSAARCLQSLWSGLRRHKASGGWAHPVGLHVILKIHCMWESHSCQNYRAVKLRVKKKPSVCLSEKFPWPRPSACTVCLISLVKQTALQFEELCRFFRWGETSEFRPFRPSECSCRLQQPYSRHEWIRCHLLRVLHFSVTPLWKLIKNPNSNNYTRNVIWSATSLGSPCLTGGCMHLIFTEENPIV